jgi:hypothetical protein
MTNKKSTCVPDFKIDNRWIRSFSLDGKRLQTISGRLYNNMLMRTNSSSVFQVLRPTYKGCINAFEDFDSFTNWHINQVGYGLGYHLDADILCKGVKTYSEGTCVLVPQYVNAFFVGSEGHRGEFPEGLSLDKRYNNIRVRISSAYHGGKVTHLGLFKLKDIDKARELFRVEKNKACKYLKEKLISENTMIDPRVLSAIDKWEHICDWKGFN